MRNLLPFPLALLAAAPLAAQAQQATPSLAVGLKGGASLTSLTNRSLASNRDLCGFHAGVTATRTFTRTFALQAELLYSQKGTRDEVVVGSTHYDNRQRLHYLDLPVVARLHVGNAYLEAGPQLGLLLLARGHYEGPGPGAGAGDQTVSDYFHRVDLGYVAGIGYQVPGGPGLGLRYNGGLLNAVNNNFSGSAVRNRALQLYVSYQFPR
ncbi:PorT family protein [Hymenobacter sp. RP-2-7]|uniref:PorT family protein n=1 Tax=Hymenobacter polaris TaxID=2682546 RepID=A0A7Y0AD80_9BACT|nr:porin family protein [Hymenobacter polaris]NML65151.1 PorT family protein [Hymenobacter polaris]